MRSPRPRRLLRRSAAKLHRDGSGVARNQLDLRRFPAIRRRNAKSRRDRAWPTSIWMRYKLSSVGPACAALVVAIASAFVAASAPAATSSTVVTMTVPSATYVNAGGCLPGVAGKTSSGTVLPGTSAVTTTDCVVEFGSSNDTSMLRMFQSDAGGDAMLPSPVGGSLAMWTMNGSLKAQLVVDRQRRRRVAERAEHTHLRRRRARAGTGPAFRRRRLRHDPAQCVLRGDELHGRCLDPDDRCGRRGRRTREPRVRK